jgi:WD40 repeat protein
MGLDFTLGQGGGRFVDATPADFPRWQSPFDAAMDAATGNVIVFSAGELIVLKPGTEAGKTTYVPGPTRDLDTDEAALLAVAGDRLLVALADGDYRLLDAGTLEPTGITIPRGPGKPRQAIASPDGRFLAVVSHQSEAWLLDAATGQPVTDGAISGDIHALAFNTDSHLFVGDVYMRVSEYTVPDFERVARHDPSLSTLQATYRYGVLPVYTIFPKPGELNTVISRLFEEDNTVTISGNNDDLKADQIEIDIQTPLVSNAAFLLVVLALTCLYVSRKDF